VSARKPLRVAAAAAAAIAVTATFGPAVAHAAGDGEAAAPRLALGKPEDLGKPIRSVAILSSQVVQEDGRPVLVAIANGNVPVFNAVDLRTNRLLRSFELPRGSGSCWGGTVTPDGVAYLITGQRMFRYDPKVKKVEDLGAPVPGEGAYFQLAHDEAGNVYGGTYPRGKVFRYDPRVKKYDVLGDVGQTYARTVAYHGGRVYAGTGPTPHGKIVSFDVRTGAREELPLPEMAAGKPSWVYTLSLRGGRYLFAFLSDFPDKSKTLRVYDLAERRWQSEEFPGYGDLYLGPERDGKTYFRWKGHWQEFDLATRRTRALPPPAIDLSHRGGGWADLGEGRGTVIASAAFDGTILLTDPDTGKQTVLPAVSECDATDLQAMAPGPGGRLYLSAFLAGSAGVFDTATGATALIPMGQAEGIVSHGDRVWWGVYPGARLSEMDARAPIVKGRNPREAYAVPDHQDRPFGMAASADWVVAGTIPDYGRVGGALAVQDRRTGAWRSYRDVVPGQSVVSTAIRGDIVYGSTSIYGGLGSSPTATEAKVFAWDLRAGRKVTETTLSLEGRKAPRFIGGVAFGPDGLLWGVADGAVFALDPKTLAVRKQRVVYPDVASYGRFRPQFVGFGRDGLLYANPAGRLTVLDPETMAARPGGIETDLMTLGPDGHLYYRPTGDPARLMRIRVPSR